MRFIGLFLALSALPVFGLSHQLVLKRARNESFNYVSRFFTYPVKRPSDDTLLEVIGIMKERAIQDRTQRRVSEFQKFFTDIENNESLSTTLRDAAKAARREAEARWAALKPRTVKQWTADEFEKSYFSAISAFVEKENFPLLPASTRLELRRRISSRYLREKNEIRFAAFLLSYLPQYPEGQDVGEEVIPLILSELKTKLALEDSHARYDLVSALVAAMPDGSDVDPETVLLLAGIERFDFNHEVKFRALPSHPMVRAYVKKLLPGSLEQLYRNSNYDVSSAACQLLTHDVRSLLKVWSRPVRTSDTSTIVRAVSLFHDPAPTVFLSPTEDRILMKMFRSLDKEEFTLAGQLLFHCSRRLVREARRTF